ncbi:MAG TPA: DUF4238 domain-containing protein, partial [Micavibrio sp.]
EKYDFAHFLALMHYRTRAMKRILSELYARELQIESYKIAADDVAYARWLENYEQGNNKTYTAAEAEELRAAMMDYSGYTFEVPKNHWLAAFQGIDKLAKVFYQLNWRIGEAKHHYFITADVPVAKNTDGFVHPLTTVTMPLSRKRILIMSRRPMKQGIVALDRDTVIGENQNRASHAERELYAHIKHKDLVRLAKNNKSAGAQLIYSGFGPKNYADVQVPRKWQVDST